MVDRQIVEGWINKGDEELEFAKVSLEEGLEFYAQVCFFFHQAPEKYLKAYIIANELNLKRIHDLLELLRVCAENDEEFNNFYEEARILNPFYMGTRYPEFFITFNKSRTEQALGAAEAIASFVKSKLQ